MSQCLLSAVLADPFLLLKVNISLGPLGLNEAFRPSSATCQIAIGANAVEDTIVADSDEIRELKKIMPKISAKILNMRSSLAASEKHRAVEQV